MCSTKIVVYASGILFLGYSYWLRRARMMEQQLPEPEDINDLFTPIQEQPGLQPLPIVYNKNYDVKFWGIERFHPFDTQKWGRIYNAVKVHFQEHLHQNASFISPKRPVNKHELGIVHVQEFIKAIHSDKTVIANAAEIFFLAFLPLDTLESKLLTPMKWQVAGSILAARQALDNGWAINLGGGFHHASTFKAEGFCFFADITLIMKVLWKHHDENLKFMIIDLDAHQGNGYARDVQLFSEEKAKQVYIVDFFNPNIYPFDAIAKTSISRMVEIDPRDDDDAYMAKLREHLKDSLAEFKPNLIIYNAGTDCLQGDPLGKLNLSRQGIVDRDEIVFQAAGDRKIPIVMLTSGGYQQSNAGVISDSISNLYTKGWLKQSAATSEPHPL